MELVTRMSAEKKKNPLVDDSNKHIRTAFIGAIAKFEEIFGELWGHFHDDELNEQERIFHDKWEDVRTKILDLGNLQIRNNTKLLNTYKVYRKDNRNEKGNILSK